MRLRVSTSGLLKRGCAVLTVWRVVVAGDDERGLRVVRPVQSDRSADRADLADGVLALGRREEVQGGLSVIREVEELLLVDRDAGGRQVVATVRESVGVGDVRNGALEAGQAQRTRGDVVREARQDDLIESVGSD